MSGCLRRLAWALTGVMVLTFASLSEAPAQFRRNAPKSDCVLDRCGQPSDATSPNQPAKNQPAQNQPEATPNPTPDSDNAIVAPPTSRFRRGPSAATGNFDFYVLSLSWSSGFCATNDRAGGKGQCDIGSNLGFVVHGLWPQFERGFPSDCDPSARPPTRTALDAAKGLFPDEGLARYEWRKHGACSGKSAADYFADVRFAHDKVKIPAEFVDLRAEERVSPSEIMSAFQTANPRLRPGMMAVGCTRGVLQEVRICLSKDLRDFRPCPEVARSSCRTREVRVPPIH